MSECSKHERERRQGSPCPYCRIAELEAEQQRRDLLISEAASARAAQEARIAELEAAKELQFEIMALKEQTIDDLQARLELKTAMPWEEDWERGYVCGWNECRKAALRGDDDQ